jgi:hypothetical protein
VRTIAPWFPVVLALAAAGWALRAWHAQQRARDTLIAFALSSRWDYRPTDPALVDRWILPPFGQGQDRQVRHVISGRRGAHSFVAFEYEYVDVTRDSKGRERRRRRHCAVVALQMPGWLPSVTAIPESWHHRVTRAIGEDVELESEEFNRRYVIRGSARTASDLLTPRAMAALCQVPPFDWRVEGTDLLSWQRVLFTPSGLLARLSILESLLDTAPAFLWESKGHPRSVTDRGQGVPGSGA